MKPLAMKQPALEQIYNQRYMYEQHKKKLMKIYEERKSQLGYDSNRTSHFEQIKESKTKTFIHKFNKQNHSIAKENLKLLGKLENARPSLRGSEEHKRQRSTLSCISPFTKQRLLETEKENMRISNRMKNMSSSLNQKNFVREYAKSQQIKNRLMRFSSNDSKVYLKSERYFDDDGKHSMTSYDRELKQPEQAEDSSSKKKAMRPSYRKSAINHYKRDEIAKNKVDVSTSNLANIRAKYQKNRSNTSMNVKANLDEEAGTFFPTEPKRQKLKSFNRKVHLP